MRLFIISASVEKGPDLTWVLKKGPRVLGSARACTRMPWRPACLGGDGGSQVACLSHRTYTQ